MFSVALAFIMMGVAYAAELKWDGDVYEQYYFKDYKRGYVEEYTNNDEFCHSYIIPPGFSLGNRYMLGCIYFLGLSYLFLGIAIVSDVFMA